MPVDTPSLSTAPSSLSPPSLPDLASPGSSRSHGPDPLYLPPRSVFNDDECAPLQKPRLLYFGVKGRAEPIRLAFAIAGVDFEDVRLTERAFLSRCRSGSLPYEQLPVLEMEGHVLSQSFAIMTFVGRRTGLMPAEAWEEAKAAEFVLGVDEAYSAIAETVREEDVATKMKMRTELASVHLPRTLACLDALAASNSTPGYAVGSSLSMADLVLFNLISWLRAGVVSGVPKTLADKHTHIMQIHATVQSHPRVQEWYQRPRRPTKRV
ncbi:unnamed protein product [Vitrella brassicaformis CCMP3155]|uniref:Glutathione S-transferase n=1 Tax=Vitrella brassicaformis (strain CCMP3155) TaxID=1169540 RepID=A0A0G4GKI1_VITBC|nr:unnamed protein product [Vitrella brassicaformis CCMP3155]|eukprot:CEM30502.1 unnamed protein product [Vitrella brassicaformis CCMP3155]